MKRTLVVVGLAAALVLAGCAGPGGEGVNETENDTDAVANDTGNATFGNETNDTGLTGNDTNETGNATFGNDTGANDTGNATFGNETNDTGPTGNDTNDTNMSVEATDA